jgi:ribosomal protein S18 acetylase RimI-like enzyme
VRRCTTTHTELGMGAHVTLDPQMVDIAEQETVDAPGEVDELTAVYREVYAEPPYGWGNAHAELFEERFAEQSRAPGFRLITARRSGRLVGFAFGVTLRPTTRWWSDLLPDPGDTIGAELTQEWPGRTFAVVELLVRKEWRRQGIATRLTTRLLAARPERRATLTVHPDATAAQCAYRKWGWRTVARKQNPLPGSPIFDVMIKDLGGDAR